MHAQGFGRKGAAAGGTAPLGNAMPARSIAVQPQPMPSASAEDDRYAQARAEFLAQERASGGFRLDEDDNGTLAWRTPTTGKSWSKSGAIAYLLWFFTGAVAGHRLYLGRYPSAAAQSVLGLIAFSAILIAPHSSGVWGPLFLTYGMWRLLDLFLIPGMCRNPPASF